MIWQKKLSFLSLFCLFSFFNFFLFSSSSFAAMYTYTGSSTLINSGSGVYIVKFLTSGTFTPVNDMTVNVLVVGGGGGGGSGSTSGGGGGGGGGLIYNSSYMVSGSTTVTIGNGGAAHTKGENSVFGSLVAIGGGRGGNYSGSNTYENGGSGGSGGGGSVGYPSIAGTGGIGTSEQGHNGGSGYVSSGPGAGAGGGAGAVGANGSGSTGGVGGNGLAYSISGTYTYYAGGGGGSSWGPAGGSGGLGGGGQGGNIGGVAGVSGSAHTGGGGGGQNGVGGSGIVIIRFIENIAPVCGTWSPGISPWKSSGAQTFTLSGSSDNESGINVSGGSCTTGSANSNTCTITISDVAGNTTVCTSPANRVDAVTPTISSITEVQHLNTESGQTVPITVTGLSDTGGSGLANLKYAYFVPGSTDWTYTTVFNTASSYTVNVPITVEGAYYVAVAVQDNALNWSDFDGSKWKRTSIIINRTSPSPPPSSSPTFTKKPQISEIDKGSFVSLNGYLFIKLGEVGETGLFLAVTPMCETPALSSSEGILTLSNTLYTGLNTTPGEVTVSVLSPGMHGTCTWSSTTDPTLSSITSYVDSNHCLANINASVTTTYTVSMTGCLTNPTTSLTVSLADFAGE